MGVDFSSESLSLTALNGRWYIHLTNFPMWLKGDRTSPSFNYKITWKGGREVLEDRVEYWQKGKNRTIVGYDWPLDEHNRTFAWRGKGLLWLLESRWEILYMDPKGQWAIIYFRETLFTPEGYDVIARSPTLEEEMISEMQRKLSDLKISEELTLIS